MTLSPAKAGLDKRRAVYKEAASCLTLFRISGQLSMLSLEIVFFWANFFAVSGEGTIVAAAVGLLLLVAAAWVSGLAGF
jgi:uncharacterized protein (DUF1800 family)